MNSLINSDEKYIPTLVYDYRPSAGTTVLPNRTQRASSWWIGRMDIAWPPRVPKFPGDNIGGRHAVDRVASNDAVATHAAAVAILT